ncbi:glycosyltransferase [Sphingobacterium sp. WM]|uniref:glycosyltransferase n=1 Tax=Sphingobacterium sp. WM TaxID=3031802 RepID=UPI00240D0D39|nr:glycosyltransferase [Sphingobacterium sp. WM]WFB63713.1 glycosyltransferase [Sphingobacterium sp. WM]
MRKTILFIGLVWPEPTSSAAGWRMLQLVDLFLSHGYKITFASAASKSEFSFPLLEKDVQEIEITLNDSSFDEIIKELNPEIVLFDRFMIEEQYSWRVAQNCPDAIRILDTEDLHFVRQGRQNAYKKGIELDDSLLYSDLAKRELAAIYRSDLSLIISAFEMNLLQEEFNVPKSLLCYLPFQVSHNQEQSNYGFEDREHFTFIGNFLHEPNWKTVQVIKELWPSIRKRLPEAEMHIYGAYPTEKVWQLNQPKQGFRIMGRADHAIETLKKYRVLFAPIPFGAGLKGKFIDALYAGTPSVSSKVGAEAMFQNQEWPGTIASTTNELIDASTALYQDSVAWNTASKTAEKILKSLIDPNWGMEFLTQIEKLETDLNRLRMKNMVGQILWSNQFLASKYLSQWIEEKNKK